MDLYMDLFEPGGYIFQIGYTLAKVLQEAAQSGVACVACKCGPNGSKLGVGCEKGQKRFDLSIPTREAQNLRSNIIDLLFAGAETTATTLNWAILLIIKVKV